MSIKSGIPPSKRGDDDKSSSVSDLKLLQKSRLGTTIIAKSLQQAGVRELAKLSNQKGFAGASDYAYEKHLNEYIDAFGDGGYNVMACTVDGTKIVNPNPILNPDGSGTLVFPDKNGVYRFRDGQALRKLAEHEEQVHNHLNDLLNYCKTDNGLRLLMATDDISFCNDEAKLRALIGDDEYISIPKTLRDADCTPSVYQQYDALSREFCNANGKLRAILRASNPSLFNSNTNKAIRREVS